MKKFEILQNLKGKSYEEGLKIVESTMLEEDLKGNNSYAENGYVDLYVAKEDTENWVCFSAPYKEIKDDEDIVDYKKGYWAVMEDGEYKTELELID